MKTVTTKTQLKKSLEKKEDVIYVEGKLANSLMISKKATKLGKVAIAILTVGLCSVPVTGGLSAAAVAPTALAVGLDTSVVIAIVAVGGIVLVLAIFKDYNVEITKKDALGNVEQVKLTKK